MQGFIGTASASVIALAAMAGGALAQDVTLRLSNWLPPTHPIVSDIMVPWSEQVAEATEGRVEVQILDAALGPPPAHFDLAATGAADLTFSVHGYTPGRFVLNELAELPFLTPNSEALSVAYWRLFEEKLAEHGEHSGVKVLGVWGHGPGHLFTTRRDVTPLDALEGARIRVAGSITNQLVEEMGMVSMQAPSSEAYELLSNNVADGIVFPYESIPFFRLDDLVSNALRVEGGLYNVSFFFVMNEGRWNSLSEEDQAAIESVSGEAVSRMAGQAWDRADAEGLAVLEDKVNFHDATEEEMERIREAADVIYDGVRERVSERGVDFDAAVEFLQAETEKVLAE